MHNLPNGHYIFSGGFAVKIISRRLKAILLKYSTVKIPAVKRAGNFSGACSNISDPILFDHSD